MLAFIYLSEKNYPKAPQCYESFAIQSADPAADWRLLQFYLADYQHHKADFLEEVRGNATLEDYQPLQFQKEAKT